jgi:hypothetical protein
VYGDKKRQKSRVVSSFYHIIPSALGVLVFRRLSKKNCPAAKTEKGILRSNIKKTLTV